MPTGTGLAGLGSAGPLRVLNPASPLSVLVSRPALGVPGDTRLADAADVMSRSSVSALLVDGLAAVVTERDIARAFGAGMSADDPVNAIATRHPVVVPGATTVLTAAGMVLNEHVRHLVVELWPRPPGIVSMRDVLAVLLQTADPQLWLHSLRVVIEQPSDIWLG